MAKYKKRPVVVEATQWLKNGDHPKDNSQPISQEDPSLSEGELVRYFRDPSINSAYRCHHCERVMRDHGWIETLESGPDGGHVVCPGDWIITGVQGEKYPCKDEIFRLTYEPVVEERTE